MPGPARLPGLRRTHQVSCISCRFIMLHAIAKTATENLLQARIKTPSTLMSSPDQFPVHFPHCTDMNNNMCHPC